jgi:Leucine-rich repeat (LRR) protein/serine/threonine protein phosphatase PrpC
VLSLSTNRIEELPPEIGSLKALRRLDVTNNLLRALPAEFAQLMRLEELYLAHNRFACCPAVLGALRQLVKLDLRSNRFRALPDELSGLCSLKTLDLGSNRFEGVPDVVCGLAALVDVNLSHNRVHELSTSLRSLGELTYMRLGHNRIRALPSSVGHMTGLMELDLSGNQLSTVSVQDVGRLSYLGRLDLSGNRLRELPDAVVGELTYLQEVLLAHNHLERLPATLEHCTQLEVLSARGNRIQRLPNVSALVRLRYLDLSDNRLVKLPDTLGTLTNLEHLNLSFNRLERLPDALGTLQDLNALLLAHNRLVKLPKSVGKLCEVQVLHASHNRLSDLPENLTQMRRLRELYLADNCFTRMPDVFTRLVRLRVADLSGNPLTAMPTAGLERMALRELQLNRCTTLTSLPDELASLQHLRQLHAEHSAVAHLPPALSPRAAALRDGGGCLSLLYGAPVHQAAPHRGPGRSFSAVGHASMNGRRAEMQDAATVCEGLFGRADCDLVAVFDGHGGRYCSVLGSERLPALVDRALRREAEKVEADTGAAEAEEGRAVVVDLITGEQVDAGACTDAEERAAEAEVQTAAASVHSTAVAATNGTTTTLSTTGSSASMGSASYCLLEKPLDEKATALRTAMAHLAAEMSDVPDGTTCVCVLLFAERDEKRRRLYLANVGDSRAVLSRNGKAYALSVDHTPRNRAEEERVLGIPGGFIANGRVQGKIAVSRSLGDNSLSPFVIATPDLLQLRLRVRPVGRLSAERQQRRGSPPPTDNEGGAGEGDEIPACAADTTPRAPASVHKDSTPGCGGGGGREVVVVEHKDHEEAEADATDETDDHLDEEERYDVGPEDEPAELLVLACDGVWDVLSNQEAVDLALSAANPVEGAELIRDLAYLRGSTDNITACVVWLVGEHHSP